MKLIESVLERLNAIPHDKVFHFAGGGLLAALGLLASPAFSLVVVLVASLGKEAYDGTIGKAYGHQFDMWDAVATLLGGVPVWLTLLVRYA